MKSYEIFQKASDELINEVFNFFRDNDRQFYSGMIASLAQDRKLRPNFITKKPVTEQIAWAHKTLKLRSNDGLGEHILQTWFMQGHTDVLVKFCDVTGIEHDGNGTVTGSLPDTLEDEKIVNAIDTLFDSFNAKLVTIYLHIFNLQRVDGWPKLTEILAGDERLEW